MTESGVALPAEELRVYQGDEFVNFRNHTYQWVSIKLFALPAKAEYAAPLPDLRRGEMERELYPRIRNATACYQLADMRDTAQHDEGWGSSVGSATGFLEFVLIDRNAGSVALIVATDD